MTTLSAEWIFKDLSQATSHLHTRYWPVGTFSFLSGQNEQSFLTCIQVPNLKCRKTEFGNHLRRVARDSLAVQPASREELQC